MRNDKWRWQVYIGVSDVPAFDDQRDFDTAGAACASAVEWIEQRPVDTAT
jgi:hypothetical protein